MRDIGLTIDVEFNVNNTVNTGNLDALTLKLMSLIEDFIYDELDIADEVLVDCDVYVDEEEGE